MSMATVEKRQRRIGVVVPTISDSGGLISQNLIKVLSAVADDVYFIAGNATRKDDGKVHVYGMDYKKGTTILAQMANQVCLQLRISYCLARLARNIDLWIFFLGAEGLLLPMLTAKLLRRKVVLALAGYLEKEGEFSKNVLYIPLKLFKRINCALSNRLVVYSESLVEQWHLGRYRHKILVGAHHFVDFNIFKIEKKLGERAKLVGYVGRLSQEKGVWNFLEAVSIALERENNLKCLIVGDGQLRGEIKEYLKKNNLSSVVKLAGQVPHEELPSYLNELKLLVLPSYTEGLPNIVLEAMACGTPILATPVGAIPDIIKDAETGFVLENNSPQCIASNVMKVLSHPDLSKIVNNAKGLVEKEFTFEAAVERYNRIINDLVK
jgi:glycosyltransferase involved in cell wall biosynthesis